LGRDKVDSSSIAARAKECASSNELGDYGQGFVAFSSASFYYPERILPSAWTEHAPFAFWLLDAAQPRTIVELGTYGGYSYLCFCQGVKCFAIEAACHAIDTWRGDEHSGFYGEEVYETLRAYHDGRYSAFSRLHRCTFDEALPYFADSSIDLLHIDGRHFFEDVAHDFGSWEPKLSKRGIVLLHDTNVRERKFGVAQLWEGLRARYPSFEFYHGHGLGVLGIGQELPSRVAPLFAAPPSIRTTVRTGYAHLGNAVAQRERLASMDQRIADLQLAVDQRASEKDALSNDIGNTRQALAEAEAQTQEAMQALLATRQALAEARQALAEAQAQAQEAIEASLAKDTVIAEARSKIVDAGQKAAEVERNLDAQLRLKDEELVTIRNTIARQEYELQLTETELASKDAKILEIRNVVSLQQNEIRSLTGVIEAIRNSAAWRITTRIRTFGLWLASLRKTTVYWLMTPHAIPRRLKRIHESYSAAEGKLAPKANPQDPMVNCLHNAENDAGLPTTVLPQVSVTDKRFEHKPVTRVAMVGQTEYFACHFESDLDDLFDMQSFHLRFDVGPNYYHDLCEFNPDITFVFRGELMPRETIASLPGIKVAYSTEPMPKLIGQELQCTTDSLGRFKNFLNTFVRPFDYVFHYDEASRTFLESQGINLSGYAALPIATDTYRPLNGPKTRGILFVGRSTEHRERILGPLKRDFDVLHLAHGWPGHVTRNLRDFLRCIDSFHVVLNLHGENEISWEPRVQQMLACGALVVSEPISVNEILQPGVHFIEANGPAAFYETCKRLLAHPESGLGIRSAGLEQVRSSLSARKWFATFFNSLMANHYQRAFLNGAAVDIAPLELMLKHDGFEHLAKYAVLRNA
jgi:hypothetical protein